MTIPAMTVATAIFLYPIKYANNTTPTPNATHAPSDLVKRIEIIARAVIPAKAGSHAVRPDVSTVWIPAFAGMTVIRRSGIIGPRYNPTAFGELKNDVTRRVAGLAHSAVAISHPVNC